MLRNSYKIPIQRLFFLYLLAFLVLILLGGVVVLSLSGGLRSVSDMAVLLNKEKDHLAQNVRGKFSDASAQAVSLSRTLSASLERRLGEHNLSMLDLSGRPEVLADILGGEVNRLLFALEKTKCSGVFVVLNATVNMGVENADSSRAGIYIRNIDKGFMDRTANQLFLRGPSQIAIAEGFTLQTRWALEFDVRNQPFWKIPLRAREDLTHLPLSRLYYWYFTDNFPGLSENTAVCSVPLLDSEGRFLGVAGFETGNRRFALENPPAASNTPNVTGLFFSFSSPDEKKFHPGKALFAGNAALGCSLTRQHEVTLGSGIHGLDVFRYEGGDFCVGLWSEMTLYPDDSPFAANRFATAIVVPRKDFEAIVSASRLRLVLIITVLLCAGVALSLFLSDRYEKPFKELINALRSGDMSAKSNIQEIDDLIEFMHSRLNETRAAGNGIRETAEDAEIDDDFEENMEKIPEAATEALLDSFITNTKKLSRAEADVFNLYLEGHTAQEIAEIMTLSINTIKSHNKRIFAKLNVSSRKELLNWLAVLTASGRSLDDSQQKQFDKIRNIVKDIKDTTTEF